MKTIPARQIYRFFEPRPIILLGTFDGQKPNIMTASLYNTLSEQPCALAVNLGPWDRTLQILQTTNRAVISIPTADLLETMVKIGNSTGIDKFAMFKLRVVPASSASAALIKNALANFEADYIKDETLEQYGMYTLKITAGYFGQPRDPRTIRHNGDGTFTLTGETVNLKHLMTRYPEYTAD
jgi:flavin reductase (DIM6/NTAB) family NADH-FMN oxidoreductase RutF